MTMGGFRIGTIRGIPIRIHWTFLLVLPVLAFAFSRAFRAATNLAAVPPELLSGSPLLWGVALALALFASVLVHELAHSLYALRKGGKVRAITLLMIGGVSQISEAPKKTRDEAVMALVGPVTSLALGLLFYLVHSFAGRADFNLRFAVFYLGSLNLFLGVFNLLPAFPMDGGRILRALLAGRFGLVRATNIASSVGKVFAVLFALWGFVSFNMFLVLIAFFVFVGADAEKQAVVVKALLGRLRVRDVMSTRLCSVADDVSVRDAAERMLRERRLALATTVDGRPVGLITLDAVQAVPPERRAETPARSIAVEIPPLSPEDDVAKALQLMTERNLPQLAVAEDGNVVGSISRDDVVRGLRLTELEATQHDWGRWSHPVAGWRP